MSGPLIVGLLVATATYLILQRGLVRVVLGVVVLGHATHILLLLAGGIERRGIPFPGTEQAADPLPQAFALTAIVISFGITAFLLGLAYRWSDFLVEPAEADADEDEGEAEGP